MQLKIQSVSNPYDSAIIVPIKGEVIKAMENEMPFNPIYEPRLNVLDRLTATVDAKGIIRISEIEISKIDRYKTQTAWEGSSTKNAAPQNKVPMIILVESVNFLSA